MVHKKKKMIELETDIKFLNKEADNLSLKAEETHNKMQNGFLGDFSALIPPFIFTDQPLFYCKLNVSKLFSNLFSESVNPN